MLNFLEFTKKAPDILYIVIEKMNTSLSKCLIENKDEFTLSYKVLVLQQVTEGMCYLHHHSPSLVRHDLTPNNILFNRSTLQTKLTDFGMTRVINLHQQSSVKGTEAFIPLEGLKIPPRYTEMLDIFSFGNCVLTTLTHQWPNPSTLGFSTEFEKRKQQIDRLDKREKDFFCLSLEGV